MKRKRFLNFFIAILGVLLLVLVVRAVVNVDPIGDKVAVIDIVGQISRSDAVIEQIHRYRDNGSVKAIVIRVDSVGGGVAPVQEIYSELRKLRKPVVASLGGMAISGGYYIACAADPIFANPGTLTGSIGVIMQFMKVKGLYDKVGIEQQVVKSGQFKDTGSPIRNLSVEEQALLQATIDDVHHQFVEAIAEKRGDRITRDQVLALADGRIFSGNQALERKLVDRLGNLPDAIEHAAQLGGIVGRPKIARIKRETSWLERVLGMTAKKQLGGLLDRTGGLLRYQLHFGE